MLRLPLPFSCASLNVGENNECAERCERFIAGEKEQREIMPRSATPRARATLGCSRKELLTQSSVAHFI